jgi:hypothetical protein
MKKPWSISTTVRNPERIRGFLEAMAEFEGKTFDEQQQVIYQIKLIQKKLYQPIGLSSELLKFYDSPSDMTFDQAKKIFEHMKKTSKVLGGDVGLRGRTSAAVLGKMGLAIIKATAGEIKITDFGRKFLNDEIDIGEVFLSYFYKWSLHNPDSTDFTAKDGFNIRPFIATLRIIGGVNEKWKSMGGNPVGLSKEEFNTFVPTTINYEDIPKTIDDIVKLRSDIRGKPRAQQRRIFRKAAEEMVKTFFNDDDGGNIALNLRNLKDYGDNVIRYFKLTRFFQIRGGGFYVDLEPKRGIEIKSLLEESDGRRLELNDMDAYMKFMDSEIDYPWETPDKLKAIAAFLVKDTISIDKSLSKPLGVQKELEKIDVDKLKKDQLKTIINDIRNKRKEVQEQQNHLELIDPMKLRETITGLVKIYDSEDRPVQLEYLITLSLHAINDALKIQPNYPVGDDNKPTFTAPANVPDIECVYKSFCLICEVTMLTNRNQWFAEGQPVMRHLRDFETKNNGKSLCLFIAPKIHRDTFNTFSVANKYEYEGQKQKIIPLSITQFLKILDRVFVKKTKKKPITQQEFGLLLEKLYQSLVATKDVDDWTKAADKMLVKYAATGELA